MTDKQIGFGIIVVAFLVGFIAGPVKHLWTGEIRYRKYKLDEWFGWIRRRQAPGKFYFHVIFEIVTLLILFVAIYWIMFRMKVEPG